MNNPKNFNALEEIKKTQEIQEKMYALQLELDSMENELQAMKRNNALNISIAWKEAILYCLSIEEIDGETTTRFLRTTGFLSRCVAWNYGVETSRELKSNVASTLSFLFKNKEIGRYEDENGKRFYGLKKYFKTDLQTLKEQYKNISLLAA